MKNLAWFKSSYSGAPNDDCVEAALLLNGHVAVRDSKQADLAQCRFGNAAWRRFLAACLAHDPSSTPG
ncbi:DUF397 domain-containing protein [Streptomyces sulphureus]|uniref:DUF397 domain-containing protein n=1 Tax=Streptomyces sulphureus TaxID=47758 RepID=UPI000366AA8B|nr:DUF397 domain-containing protein [Streptomyces sulphureus]